MAGEVKPVDLEEMSEAEKQNYIVGLILGVMYGPVWFLERHYGKDAVKKYHEWGAKEHCQNLRAFGITDPLSVLTFAAKNEKYLLGSDVELEGNKDQAVLRLKECGRLKHALHWARHSDGPESTINRDEHCQLCLNSIYKSVAHAMNFDFSIKFSDKGCEITVKKKS
jgi:hypothetical protein